MRPPPPPPGCHRCSGAEGKGRAWGSSSGDDDAPLRGRPVTIARPPGRASRSRCGGTGRERRGGRGSDALGSEGRGAAQPAACPGRRARPAPLPPPHRPTHLQRVQGDERGLGRLEPGRGGRAIALVEALEDVRDLGKGRQRRRAAPLAELGGDETLQQGGEGGGRRLEGWYAERMQRPPLPRLPPSLLTRVTTQSLLASPAALTASMSA